MQFPETPRDWIAQIVGIVAIIIFLLSYQQKDRKKIIIWNATSRILYILQYCLLLSFGGAALDILGIIASLLAARKDRGFIGRHKLLFFLLSDAAMIIAALLLVRDDPLVIFSLIGVLLHTGAFWISNEKTIRILSLVGSPFWFIYNLLSMAYPSAVGDAMTMVSIIVAMIRYDRKKRKEK